MTPAPLNIPGSNLTVNREKMRRRYMGMLSKAPLFGMRRPSEDTSEKERR